MTLFKLTREVTVPIAQYHNDKVFISVEEEVDDIEKAHKKYSDLLSKIIKLEYPKIKQEAIDNKEAVEPNTSAGRVPNYKPF